MIKTTQTTQTTGTRRDASIVFLVALVCPLLLFALVTIRNPPYLSDYRATNQPDAIHYVRLGENLFTRGVYSRQTEPPYQPDVVRTPVYPVLAGLVQSTTHRIWLLYLFQILLNAATAAITYLAARLLFGRPAALVAGILYGLDLVPAVMALTALTEIVYGFLSMLAVLLWLSRSSARQSDGRVGLLSLVPAGLLFGVSILTRPAGLYLPIVVAVVEVGLARQAWRTAVVPALAMVVAAYIVVAPWIVRNRVLFNVTKLTTADTINLTYFAAAGVYQLRYGLDRVAAQARIASDYQLTPVERTNNPWLSSEDVATMDRRQSAAAREIIKASPALFVRASITGVVKATVSHNADLLASEVGGTWPGGVISGLRSGGLAFAWRIGPALMLTFAWETLLAIGGLGLAVVGFAYGVSRADTRPNVLAVTMLIGYVVLTIAVVGLDAYSRHRVPALPFLYMLAGLGVTALWTGAARSHA